MIEVNIQEADTPLSRLLARVAEGEEVVISQAGKPVARLIPYVQGSPDRRPGQDKGLVKISEDFDAVPEEILDVFGS